MPKKTAKKISEGSAPAARSSHVSPRERMLFTKHLAIMIHSGLPLKESLEAIKNQTRQAGFRNMLDTIVQDVTNGQFLSTSLERYPRVFDELFTSMVRVGEESGKLSENLNYLAVQLERSDELKRKIRGAMVYPIIILIATLTVVGFITFVTLPQLLPIFISLKITLPPTTQFLFDFSRFVTGNILLIGMAVVVMILLFRLLLINAKFRYFLHKAQLVMPIFGSLVKNSQLTRFSQILGTLLAAGINIVRALEITAASMGNLVYRHELEEIAKNMSKQGENISQYLVRKPKLFSSVTERMIRIGEKTGKLDESLLYIADYYNKEIDDMVKNMTTIIEPALLLVMGVMVGFVAISVITPIYKITEGIGRR